MHIETITLLNFAHLISLVLALGPALATDALFLFRGVFRPVTAATIEIAAFLTQFVTAGLIALWATGTILAVATYQTNPEFIGNEKFWVKVFVVVVLSANALIIHHIVLPRILKQEGRRLFDGLSIPLRLALAASGGVSFASWMFPVFLGTAKELSYVVPAHQLLLAYGAALVAAVAGLSFLALAAGRHPPVAYRPSR